jgi:hypothetical protein
MIYYRAYVVGSDGHFQIAHSLDCKDDEAAIEAAKQFVDGHDVEVWQQNRKITRLARKSEWGQLGAAMDQGNPKVPDDPRSQSAA